MLAGVSIRNMQFAHIVHLLVATEGTFFQGVGSPERKGTVTFFPWAQVSAHVWHSWFRKFRTRACPRVLVVRVLPFTRRAGAGPYARLGQTALEMAS